MINNTIELKNKLIKHQTAKTIIKLLKKVQNFR
jgi:hypothetical protein